jgi:hypothetical protein
MPTSADALVAAIRKWMETGGRGSPFGSLEDPSSPAAAAATAALLLPGRGWASEGEARHAMLDHYQQHTAHCKPCM